MIDARKLGFNSLYIDQYGQKYYAKTIKELKQKLGYSRASKLYHDLNGKTYHQGYVLGPYWLTRYDVTLKEA